MRPYIICHMMSLLDGRIDCDVTEKIESGNEYYEALEKLGCPSTLMGRVTMQMHYAAPTPFVAKNSAPVAKECFHKAVEADGYLVAVDTMGKLVWPQNEVRWATAIGGYLRGVSARVSRCVDRATNILDCYRQAGNRPLSGNGDSL